MRVTLVAGQPRQGKTTLALAVARREAARLLVLDPERSRVLSCIKGVASWPLLAKWLVSPEASSATWEIRLASPNPSDYAAALRHAEYYRRVTLLLDEAWHFTDSEGLPHLTRAARASAHFGGGIGVNLVMTAQRPYDLPPDVRSCFTRLMVFQTREPTDLDYITKRFTLDPEVTARVAGLAPHEFLEFPSATSAPEPQRLSGEEVVK